MKKTYMTPALAVEELYVENIIAGSPAIFDKETDKDQLAPADGDLWDATPAW